MDGYIERTKPTFIDDATLREVAPITENRASSNHLRTVSAPVVTDDVFLGIATCDVRVPSLERLVAGWMSSAPDECVLLTPENRVIASNSVCQNVGDVVRSTRSFALHDVGPFGWVVARGHRQDPI